MMGRGLGETGAGREEMDGRRAPGEVSGFAGKSKMSETQTGVSLGTRCGPEGRCCEHAGRFGEDTGPPVEAAGSKVEATS